MKNSTGYELGWSRLSNPLKPEGLLRRFDLCKVHSSVEHTLLTNKVPKGSDTGSTKLR